MGNFFKKVKDFFVSSKGHVVGAGVFAIAASYFPQHAVLLNAIASALGYGALTLPSDSVKK